MSAEKVSSFEPNTPRVPDRTRCKWAEGDPLLIAYHDEEWGVPELDGRALWEALMLDIFQAGLSWLTVLRKRDSFRQAFDDFDPAVVSRYGSRDVERLLRDDGIIRSRPKIMAVIENARVYMAMQEAGEDLAELVWSAAGGPLADWSDHAMVSSMISEALIERGFKFVGPIVTHAWLRAAGVMNEHDHDCFRVDETSASSPFT